MASSWRSLVVPALATLAALAVLVALGLWQLERRAWKADLIAKIEARAYGQPVPVPPEGRWSRWSREEDEYRRVRLKGVFLHDKETAVHGLMSGQPGMTLSGYYIIAPLRLADGSIVLVNRGFVPRELRNPVTREAPAGEVAVTGLMRSSEKRTAFVPENEPLREEWFTRDVDAIVNAKGLTRVAPFIVDADATSNPGGWPKGGQTRLTITSPHLQYALTWFGLALALLGVFGVFAWHRLSPGRRELVPHQPGP